MFLLVVARLKIVDAERFPHFLPGTSHPLLGFALRTEPVTRGNTLQLGLETVEMVASVASITEKHVFGISFTATYPKIDSIVFCVYFKAKQLSQPGLS